MTNPPFSSVNDILAIPPHAVEGLTIDDTGVKALSNITEDEARLMCIEVLIVSCYERRIQSLYFCSDTMISDSFTENCTGTTHPDTGPEHLTPVVTVVPLRGVSNFKRN